jgi:hypothetical protein
MEHQHQHHESTPLSAPVEPGTGVDSLMGKRGAVRNDSGLPVHQSGPGLGRANNSTNSQPKAGGLPSNLLFNTSQPKTGRESEGGALSGSAAAVPSSLVPVRSNRNRPTKRKPYCGRLTLAGQSLTGKETQYHRLNCKTWGCSHCGPRKARRYKHSIRRVAEDLRLQRFLTLTLDPEKIEGDPVVYLRETFNKLRTYLRRKYGCAPKYIAVLEFHDNGKPHLHILVDRYIEQAWLSTAWEAVGGGRIVDIRFVDLHRASHYLAKYLTVDLLLSAPKGVRRITCSRGIVLLQKSSNGQSWKLLRANITYLYSRLFLLAVQLRYDDDGLLLSFVASNPNTEKRKT